MKVGLVAVVLLQLVVVQCTYEVSISISFIVNSIPGIRIQHKLRIRMSVKVTSVSSFSLNLMLGFKEVR